MYLTGAEGSGSNSKREIKQFLNMTHRSTFENANILAPCPMLLAPNGIYYVRIFLRFESNQLFKVLCTLNYELFAMSFELSAMS